jgi:16S rRNA (adenine1518-N6/adenine1519-N6)-dimethyltransferase
MSTPPDVFSHRQVRSQLSGLGTTPRKSLGQNFLVSKRIQRRILDAADIGLDDVVIEVGPGLGALTGEMVNRARRVIAIELDTGLAEELKRRFADVENLTVACGDARTIDYGALLQGEVGYKVVANLPYYAANPIIRRFLESSPKPQLMVVTVQREVARNMAAQPGKMGLLSVGIQLYARPRIVCYVPPRAFHPSPKVSSAVVRLDVLESLAVVVDDEGAFFHLARAGFSAPRKQLRNALAHGLGVPPAEAEELLCGAGIDHRRRAETLSLEEWGELYRVFSR